MDKETAVEKAKELDKYYNTLLYKPELSRLRLLYFINMFFLITLIVMPQYFGIHIGYDLTCSRLANIILVIYALMQYKVFNLFTNTFLRCSVTIPLMIYLFVTFYTMVIRVNVNAFMIVFFELLTFYMLIFAIRYVIGIKRTIKTVIGCAYFLSIYGFIEFAAGQSIFLKFLSTMPNVVSNVGRAGYYRIMGPCGHPLGYGLLLILFIAISCYDYEKNKIYLYRRPILLFMLLGNVFLTGSRSSLGIALIEIVVILLLCQKEDRKKSFAYSILILVGFSAFLALSFKTRIGNYLLMQITILIDHLLGTEFSIQFGADTSTLEGSEGYRQYLLLVFQLDWLNPLVGRGANRAFTAEVIGANGEIVYIKSIDNYYVMQFLKYAYPGLFSYLAFMITSIITMIKNMIKNTSVLSKIILVAISCYFVNLWWVDALQTLKFLYLFIAIFFAELIWQKDKKKAEQKISNSNVNY